jgi:tRNA threonylcarbamoyladenosine biosynthesis protein TsaE
MDVYRLNEEEADELGLDDYFFGAGVTLVEWARLIPDLLPDTRLAIVIAHEGESERTITITPYGSLYLNWCEQLKENGVLQ